MTSSEQTSPPIIIVSRDLNSFEGSIIGNSDGGKSMCVIWFCLIIFGKFFAKSNSF